MKMTFGSKNHNFTLQGICGLITTFGPIGLKKEIQASVQCLHRRLKDFHVNPHCDLAIQGFPQVLRTWGGGSSKFDGRGT